MAEASDNPRPDSGFPFTFWIFITMLAVAAAVCLVAVVLPDNIAAMCISGILVAAVFSILLRWQLLSESRRLERAVQMLPDLASGPGSAPKLSEFADPVYALQGTSQRLQRYSKVPRRIGSTWRRCWTPCRMRSWQWMGRAGFSGRIKECSGSSPGPRCRVRCAWGMH